MAKLIKVGDSYNIPIREYYCDTETEFETKLKNNIAIPIGSLVYIIEKKKTMIKGLSGWMERPGSGGGGTTIPDARGREF